MSELDQRFDDPPRSFSPVPIWWRSGEKLDAKRLRWQLERFVQEGVFNLLIMNLAPSGPLYGCDPDDPPFFSEAWWTIFRGGGEDARALEMRLWFYDQFGFSGAKMQARLVTQHPCAGDFLRKSRLASRAVDLGRDQKSPKETSADGAPPCLSPNQLCCHARW